MIWVCHGFLSNFPTPSRSLTSWILGSNLPPSSVTVFFLFQAHPSWLSDWRLHFNKLEWVHISVKPLASLFYIACCPVLIEVSFDFSRRGESESTDSFLSSFSLLQKVNLHSLWSAFSRHGSSTRGRISQVIHELRNLRFWNIQESNFATVSVSRKFLDENSLVTTSAKAKTFTFFKMLRKVDLFNLVPASLALDTSDHEMGNLRFRCVQISCCGGLSRSFVTLVVGGSWSWFWMALTFRKVLPHVSYSNLVWAAFALHEIFALELFLSIWLFLPVFLFLLCCHLLLLCLFPLFRLFLLICLFLLLYPFPLLQLFINYSMEKLQMILEVIYVYLSVNFWTEGTTVCHLPACWESVELHVIFQFPGGYIWPTLGADKSFSRRICWNPGWVRHGSSIVDPVFSWHMVDNIRWIDFM